MAAGFIHDLFLHFMTKQADKVEAREVPNSDRAGFTDVYVHVPNEADPNERTASSKACTRVW